MTKPARLDDSLDQLADRIGNTEERRRTPAAAISELAASSPASEVFPARAC